MEQIIQEILKHIAVLNDDYTRLASDVAVLKSQMDLLMWWFKAIMGAFIVLIVTQLWQVCKMIKK